MLYVDDRLPCHPKILKAGDLLGPGGASRALHLYLLGLAYARQNLTDGFVPHAFVSSCGAISKSVAVAETLSHQRIRLWRKVRGGYRIHDFHDWNPTANKEKEKREQHRVKMARWREAKGQSRGARDASVTASQRSYPVPVPSTSTKSTSTDAPRRLAFAREKTPATFALACVLMREALAEAEADDIATVGEHFKQLCASRGLAYDGVLVRKAFDAVQVADARRRA
jgi:hypothetical protein